MPGKVLLLSEDQSESKIQKQIEQHSNEVTVVNTLNDGIRKIGEVGFNLTVVNLSYLNEQSVTPLIKFHQFVPQMPLLVLSSQISIYAYRQIGYLDNFVTLQKPFQEEVFSSVISKIMAEKVIKPSVLPRFITDEPVRMVVLRTGLLVPTRMKNYSAGGAFLQYRGISVRVGDKIEVGFHTGEKNSSLRAEIRWIKDGDGPRSANRGVGVQFST